MPDGRLMITDLLNQVHPEWRPLLNSCLETMDSRYLTHLCQDSGWLPGKNALFNAFSQPLSMTQYILFGESPYPRSESANGYAFWDANVSEIWSEKGLSKAVNRATSLRNLIKMLLVARGDLTDDLSQQAILKVDKSYLVRHLGQVFENFIAQGFLLLNASLVLSNESVNHDALHWQGFMDQLLFQLSQIKPSIKLLLFGKIANRINGQQSFDCLKAEHPYNLSFIKNADVLEFFKPYDLLKRK